VRCFMCSQRCCLRFSSSLSCCAMSIGKFLFTHISKTHSFGTKLFTFQQGVTFQKTYIRKWELVYVLWETDNEHALLLEKRKTNLMQTYS
jgi:hypothetical protein